TATQIDVLSSYQGITAAEDHAFAQTRLRAGFLYVYHESFELWEVYSISEKGYISPLKFNNTISPNDNKEPCLIAEHMASALTITVKKPKEATNVWFKYANTMWTENIKEKYNDKVYREKYMQCLNVKAWLSGSDSQGYSPLSKRVLNTTVIDFFAPFTSINHRNDIHEQVSFDKVKAIYPYNIGTKLEKSFHDYAVKKALTFDISRL